MANSATSDTATTSGPRIFSLSELSITFPSADVRDHLSRHYSSDHLDRILKSAKTSPTATICRVNLIKTTREELIRDLTEHFGVDSDWTVEPHDLFDDVVVVSQRHRSSNSQQTESRELSILAECRKPPSTPKQEMILPCSVTDETKRSAEGWPSTHRVVILDRLCGEAVLRGSDVYVKGIMVADQGIAKGEKVAVYADLRRGEKLLRGSLIETYSGDCVFLGIGEAYCDKSAMFREDHGLGIKICRGQANRSGAYLPPTNGVLVDKMFLQNLPSILVGHALDPKPGDVILDMCAAPGGKTTHLASLTRNKALIVACDKSRRKMVTARRQFDILGASCIVPLVLDSRKNVLWDRRRPLSAKETIDNATTSKMDGLLNVKGFYPESFDKVLLDPPCSALGLRPRPSMTTENASDLWDIAKYQRGFVDNAVVLLKNGGIMTYSTCTFNSSENEAMIKYILDSHPCMKLMKIDVNFGLDGLPNAGLTDEQRQCVKRFDPSNKNLDTMGFFVAKMMKRE